MKTPILKLLAASAFAATLGVATQASAALITVAEEGGWTGSDNANDQFSGVPADNLPGVVPGVLGSIASWFTNSVPTSDLELTFFSDTQDVPTDGTPVEFLIARLAQNNVVIELEDSDPPVGSFPYIHFLDFAANFEISSAEGAEFSDTPSGTIRHTETLNTAPCTQDGSLNLAGSECDDIYSFALVQAPPINFVVDGVTYSFASSLRFRPGIVIDPGTGRIYTPEEDGNFVEVLITIQALQAPEPGTLALLGLALLGLGFAGRRNRKV